MFAARVPEKIIAENTGHNSSKSLQKYEHSSVTQLKAAGLAVSDERPFSSALNEHQPLMAIENTVMKEDEEKCEGKVEKEDEKVAGKMKEHKN